MSDSVEFMAKVASILLAKDYHHQQSSCSTNSFDLVDFHFLINVFFLIEMHLNIVRM